MKGYIQRREPHPDPEVNEATFWFCENPNEAMYWKTEQEAQNASTIYDSLGGVRITSPDGSMYIIHGFQVEEYAPEHFVLWVDAPFMKKYPA